MLSGVARFFNVGTGMVTWRDFDWIRGFSDFPLGQGEFGGLGKLGSIGKVLVGGWGNA